MIYMLRGLFDLMCGAFTGGWWFAQQEPIDWGSVPAEVSNDPPPRHESDIVDYEDDGAPLPPPISNGKKACVSCGDPNFSLDSEMCIACRSIGSPR